MADQPASKTYAIADLERALVQARANQAVIAEMDLEAHELTDDEGQDVNIGCLVIN